MKLNNKRQVFDSDAAALWHYPRNLAPEVSVENSNDASDVTCAGSEVPRGSEVLNAVYVEGIKALQLLQFL